MKNHKHLAFFFLYAAMPTLCTGILGVGVSFKWFPVADMLRALSLDILLFAPMALLPQWAALAWIWLLFPVLLGITLLSSAHLVVYGAGLSRFAIQSVLETSRGEALEFVSDFSGWGSLAVLACVMLAVCWSLRQALRHLRVRDARLQWQAVAVLCVACAAVVAVGVRKGDRFLASSTTYMVLKSVGSYAEDMEKIDDMRRVREKAGFAGVRLLDADDAAPRTYVFVIGESANRNHHSLYGYQRPTNPELSALVGNGLQVFTDVVSADTHTIPSLRKTLLFNELDADKDVLARRSLIRLLRDAGFATYWVSNQTANSDGLTGTAVLAGDASDTRFLNRARHEGNSVSHDEVLLTELSRILADPAPKKAVFLHLIGSHLSYSLRYPAQFDVFTDTPQLAPAPWRNGQDVGFINAYDNSIRYTDHIVSSVMHAVDATDTRAFVVYFSDHGQEVYDTRPIRGQDARNPSRHMVEIPFVCWLSPEYRAANPDFAAEVAGARARPFSLAWFAQSGAELARVAFEGAQPRESLFDAGYTPGPRLLPNGETYEAMLRRNGQ